MEIRNLKEWCTALEDTSKIVEQYEKTLTAFYKSVKAKPDYQTPFRTGCYTKESFGKCLLRNSPIIFLISFIASIISFGIFWLITKQTKFGIIFGIITLILITGIQIGGKLLIYKFRTNRLSKIENNIKNFMITVPTSYRASDKMKTIAMVYFTKTDINPNIILEVVDDYIRQAGRKSDYSSVMFDLPCNCPYLDGVSDSQNKNNMSQTIDTEDDTRRNEFLPADIDTKIFEGSKDSDKDLNSMIGLNDVKQQIEKFRNRISFYGNSSNNGCHMAFLGSAGTGKTTVARIITKMLFDLGYIKKNQYVEISGDYLCAGSTSRASAIIEYSYGGVLFIDEAYLMYKSGSEVIGVLLKAMEDHRKDFVCILAGYEEQMTKLFASNEGFSSRVKHSIYFGDYSEEEMLEIFNFFASNYNNSSYKLEEAAIQPLLDEFTMEKKSKSFGNARTVRNAVDAIMDYYADRSIREHSNTHIILLEDVQLYINDRKKALQHELKNASAANQLDEQIIRLAELKSRMKNGSTNPDEDLSKLVGLESFKNEIDILRNQKEFYGQIVHQKILLLGEDGCGKSTITSILTGYLHQLGYIQENKYLEIPAEMLKGSYVGHTAKRAESIISYASGGVLYIKNYNTLAENTDSFSGEAISAITTAITENKDVTIVLADKPSQSINMIRNLFTLVYEFPIYTNEQLLQIFDMQVASQNFVTDDNTRQQVYNYIVANNVSIRDIQQIFNNTIKQHIVNFNGDENYKYVISAQDLVFPQSYVPNSPTMPTNVNINITTNEGIGGIEETRVITSKSMTIDKNGIIEEKKPTQTIKLKFKPKT